MRMTDESVNYENYLDDDDYEDCYREAFLILQEGLKGIDPVHVSDDGQRRCLLGRFRLDDFQVFALAWGHKVADDLWKQRSTFLQSKLRAVVV